MAATIEARSGSIDPVGDDWAAVVDWQVATSSPALVRPGLPSLTRHPVAPDEAADALFNKISPDWFN